MLMEGHSFTTPYRHNFSVDAKSDLAAQGYKFLTGIDYGIKVSAPSSNQYIAPKVTMEPVLGFAALKRTLRLLIQGQDEVWISGHAKITIDARDENGALIVSHELDLGALGKLSSVLQKNFGQNPEWEESKGVTKNGEDMYACALHWLSGAKVYGGLHKGYPDAKMAKVFAAKAAIEDLKVKVALPGTNAQAMGQVLPWSSDDIHRDRAYPSADRYRSDPVAPHEVATGSADIWRPQGSYLNEVDSWRPIAQGDKWRPEAAIAGADVGVGASSSKRGPAQSLLKENAPLQKKVKREPGYSDFDAPLGDANPGLDYGRVEHVDGRYGFGP